MPSTNTSYVENKIAEPGVLYGLVAPNFIVPKSATSSAEPNDRDDYYFVREIMRTAQQADQILAELPTRLNAARRIVLRSSITIALPDHTMVALASRDSKTGSFYSHSHDKFKWGSNPRGIAGISSTYRKEIFIPDLKNISPSYKQAYIISSSSKLGGIVALPLLKETQNSRSELKSPAVLTVSSEQRGFFTELHRTCLTEVSWDIESVLLNNIRILPDSYIQNPVERRTPTSYDSNMGKETIPSRSSGFSENNEILNDLISRVEGSNRRGKKPVKLEEVLKKFREAGIEGVSMEDLAECFKDSGDPERSVTSFISKLNNRHLNEHGLQIEGRTVYYITSKSDTK